MENWINFLKLFKKNHCRKTCFCHGIREINDDLLINELTLLLCIQIPNDKIKYAIFLTSSKFPSSKLSFYLIKKNNKRVENDTFQEFWYSSAILENVSTWFIKKSSGTPRAFPEVEKTSSDMNVLICVKMLVIRPGLWRGRENSPFPKK